MRSILALAAAAMAFAETAYLKAPEAVRKVLDAPRAATMVSSPSGTEGLLLHGRSYPSIAEVSQPVLRLAGDRINPRTRGQHLAATYHAIDLIRYATGETVPLKLPAGARFSAPRWSPDGARFAAMNTVADGLELWWGGRDGAVRRVEGVRLNAAFGEPLQWMPGGQQVLVQLPANTGAPPPEPAAPSGPLVQESAGRAGPVRTIQDLLKSPHDEALWEHYAASQLALVDVAAGRVTKLGKPGLISSSEPAPDGRHVLVAQVHRPFSYVLAAESFPRKVEVWRTDGAPAREIVDLPMRDRVPIDGVSPGPRLFSWKPGEPATLVWVEALDGGDPKRAAPYRDRVVMLAAPFQGQPVEFAKLEHRYSSLRWFDDGSALVTDSERLKRMLRTRWTGKGEPRLIWARNSQDRYRHPGDPVMKARPDGTRVIRRQGDWIFLEGNGATPQGDRPFLDRWNLVTGKSERLFQCDAESHETVAAILDDEGKRLLTRRQTPSEPPNYFVREAAAAARALTKFRDPAPELRKLETRLVKYKRPDGVPLSFKLYLPPGYKPGTRLPALIWAYPREYGDADTAGQVSGSTKMFTTLTGASHLFLVLAGYAVLDGATMPVVGGLETANDTYIDQIVASAKAAIDQGAELGVIDPKRVAIAGHSYGGFMTANLLAHSDLFRAGIARSGAYNRTLTPFGFQAERRTLWEAPDVYLKMSPFLAANKINEPVLLIHGEADNNSGTFPIQSDRLYQAIRGNGGIVRYVVLPHEAHAYAARESVEHVIAEMTGWLDKHVKNAD